MANVNIQDVKKAALELSESGESISAAKIRGNLGRGSMTTITRFLREIRNGDAKRDLTPPEMDMSVVPKDFAEDLSEAIQAAALSIYKAIAGPVNRQIKTARDDIDLEREAMKQDVDQVLAESNDIKDVADRLRDELALSKEALGAVIAELASVRRELVLKDAATITERARHEDELAALKHQFASASSEHRNVQSRMEAMLAEAGELRGRLSAMTAP